MLENLGVTMESFSVSELVERLGSDEESVRKMAVFKLQNAIGDPSFADVFIQEGGLPKLRFLALHSTGNTLAYCLTSLSRLLELDKGWDHVTDDLVKRVSNFVSVACQRISNITGNRSSNWSSHNLSSMSIAVQCLYSPPSLATLRTETPNWAPQVSSA
jgi:hypothetical protein